MLHKIAPGKLLGTASCGRSIRLRLAAGPSVLVTMHVERTAALGARRGSRGGLVVHRSSRCRIEFDTVISQFDAGKPRFTPPTPRAASCKPLPREPNEGAESPRCFRYTPPH